jgi:hypothetical protein
MVELASLLLQVGLARAARACATVGVAALAALGAKSPAACAPLTTIAGVAVWQAGPRAPVVFRAGMAVDVDGAPKAYHPENKGALNRLSGAGRPGHWWALVTQDGAPVVQGPSDPAPGFYLSMTSLQNPAFAVTDPRRYVDASTIPYVVLPEALVKAAGIRIGDLSAAVNSSNGKVAYAIYADQGPKDKLGEGSLYLANQLRNASLPDAQAVRQSLPKGIDYVLFPGSGNGRPKTREQIVSAGEALFGRFGGAAAVKRAGLCKQ